MQLPYNSCEFIQEEGKESSKFTRTDDSPTPGENRINNLHSINW